MFNTLSSLLGSRRERILYCGLRVSFLNQVRLSEGSARGEASRRKPPEVKLLSESRQR